MKCSECGNEINVNETECKNCGCLVNETNVNTSNVNISNNMNKLEYDVNTVYQQQYQKNDFIERMYQSNGGKTKNQMNTEQAINNLNSMAGVIAFLGVIGCLIMVIMAFTGDEFNGLCFGLAISVFLISIISTTLFSGLASILANLYAINLKK